MQSKKFGSHQLRAFSTFCCFIGETRAKHQNRMVPERSITCQNWFQHFAFKNHYRYTMVRNRRAPFYVDITQRRTDFWDGKEIDICSRLKNELTTIGLPITRYVHHIKKKNYSTRRQYSMNKWKAMKLLNNCTVTVQNVPLQQGRKSDKGRCSSINSGCMSIMLRITNWIYAIVTRLP